MDEHCERWDGKMRRFLICYSGFVDKKAHPIRSSRIDRTAMPSFEELAAQQGITPIEDFETIRGEPVRDDESVEEFSDSLRGWRREGTILVARNECRDR